MAAARALALAALLGALAPPGARAVEPADVTIRRGAGTVRVATGATIAEIGLRRCRLAFRDRTTGTLYTREAGPHGLFYERGGAVHVLGVVSAVATLPDGVRLTADTDEGSPATLTVRFLTRRTLEVALDPPAPETVAALGDRLRSPRRERIYGLTERLRDSPAIAPGVVDVPMDDIDPPAVGSLDRRGETVAMRILPTFSVYAPFYQSSRGYGLAVAGTTFGLFDLARTDPHTLSFRFETGTTPASRRLVVHLFAGPDYSTILDEYTNLVGRPFVPPAWAFLHWRWRDVLDVGPPALLDGTPVNAEVADDVGMYGALGIPPGVYHFDRPVLAGNYGFAQWTWDETRLPNPAAMLRSLTSRGYHVTTWSGLWMCGGGPGDDGTQAQQLGYDAPGPAGTPNCADVGGTSFILDPTTPAAQAWWAAKVAAFLRQWGIQGIKLDRGEEHIPSEATDRWGDGRTGREVPNDYPNLQAKIHYAALESVYPDGDFVLIARPAYSGTQQWAVFWGGDIPGSTTFGAGPGTDLGLRSAIISQQRAAFMGIPIWGSDTGGYYQFKDREVFARWLEFSAFSGIMEIGGTGTHAPWDMPTAPAYDTEMIDIYRRMTRLRATLQPYVVAAARQAAAGLPIVRPMPFFDRHDAELADRWDQYMFGPDLMVAPIWHVGQYRRAVYFPKGTWRGYFDPSLIVTGPRTMTLPAPLGTILVFERAGAVVPGP